MSECTHEWSKGKMFYGKSDCPYCEIDRLNAELEYTKEMSNAFMDERNNLKIQLAEARAENKRLSAVVVEIANSGFGMNGNTPCTACEYNVNLCQKGLEG